jgi:plastocyanin
MRFALAVSLAAIAACGSSDKSTTQPGGSAAVLTSLELSVPGNTLALNGTMQLSATPKDQNGATYPASVVWTSGSNFVATISSSGLVSAVAGGQAYMFATTGAFKDSTLITVITGAYPTTAPVYMLPAAYSPAQIDIAVGGTVQFVFPGLGHNVFFSSTPAGAPLDIPGVVVNQSVSRTFNTRGSFGYNCTIHPGMTGTIVVH